MTTAARFVVRGLVQGVAFRAHARAQASTLGLRGHAINRDDGSVEVIAAGAPAAVEQFARWLANGPPLARVDAVTREELDATGVTAAAGFRTG